MKKTSITLLAFAALALNTFGQARLWEHGKDPLNDFGYAIGNPSTKEVYYVKSYFDEAAGFYMDKIMYTQLGPNESWLSPEPLPAPINDDFNNSVVGISEDGETLYLLGNYNAANPRARVGLSFTTKTDSGWTKPEPIKLKGLLPRTEFYSFYVTPNSEYVFATFNKSNKKDDDIFIAKKQGDGSYSELTELADIINTKESEISPFYDDASRTLFFSRYNKETNSYDMYSAKATDSELTSWSEPELFNDVNDAAFDGYYWCCINDFSFFTSDRKNPGKADIYLLRPKEDEMLASKSLMVNNMSATSTPFVVDHRELIHQELMLIDPNENPEKNTFKISGVVENIDILDNDSIFLVDNEGHIVHRTLVRNSGFFQFNDVEQGKELTTVYSRDVNKPVEVALLSNKNERLQSMPLTELNNFAQERVDIEKKLLASLEMSSAKMSALEIAETSGINGYVDEYETLNSNYMILKNINGEPVDTIEIQDDGTFSIPQEVAKEVAFMELDADPSHLSAITFQDANGMPASDTIYGNKLITLPLAAQELNKLDNTDDGQMIIDEPEASSEVIAGTIEPSEVDMMRQLQLIDANGNLVETTTIDENGNYTFNQTADQEGYKVVYTNKVSDGNLQVAETSIAQADVSSDEDTQAIIEQLEQTLAVKPINIAGKLNNPAAVPVLTISMVNGEGKIIQTTEIVEDGSFIFADVDPSEAMTFTFNNEAADAANQLIVISDDNSESEPLSLVEFNEKVEETREVALEEHAKEVAITEAKIAAIKQAKATEPVESVAMTNDTPKANNAPVKPTATRSASDKMGVHIYFGFDQTTPTELSTYQLEVIKNNQLPVKEIIGYADTNGVTSYNQTLAQKRADYTAKELSLNAETVSMGEQTASTAGLAREVVITVDQQKVKSEKVSGQIALYHDLNQADVNAYSEENLEFILDLMSVNPALKATISSHTDHQGSATYNLSLSKKRAEYVQQYLVENGIAKNRIKATWFGETQSANDCVNSDCTTDKISVNRRTVVELRVD